jgi:hypothetical protein
MSMLVRDLLPRTWAKQWLQPHMPIGVGLDQATTEKATSNPSSLAVLQRLSSVYVAALILRWKSSSQDVSHAIWTMILEDIITTQNLHLKAGCIDASNEVFHAQSLQKAALGKCPVYLIKSGEKVTFRNAEYNYKALLGNMLVTAAEDNMLALPNEEFIVDDFRLVKKDRGTFATDLGPNGEHGDTFDSTKLALWALEGRSGNVEAAAAGITSSTKNSDLQDDPEHELLFGNHHGHLAF